jgi:hypothetical protein
MKKLIVLLAAIWATTAWATVSEIREFAPTPGQTAALYKAAIEAQAIHQKLGASIYIGSDLITGNLVYVLTFPDWGAWAAFGTKLQANKDWAAFLAKVDVANPNSTALPAVYVDSPVVAKTLPVSMVYLWKINPGKFDAFVKSAQDAVAIHNPLGTSAGFSIDDLGNVGYELAFDNWAAWAKFEAALAKSKEWADFLKKANEEQNADLVRVLRLEQYKPTSP